MTSAHLTSNSRPHGRTLLGALSLDLVLRWVIALILLAAVVSKCLAPDAIAGVTAYLLHTSITSPVVPLAITVLVMIESALAAALLTGTRLVVTGTIAACFFAALTVALLVLGADPAAPQCACMGSLHGGLLGESASHSVRAGLLRNAGLIVASVMIARAAATRGAL